MIAPATRPPLAFDDVGAGEALVLLHGFPMHRGAWAPQLAGLSHVARCIAPDLAGFGASAAAPPPHTLDAMADDVVDLLDRLGVGRATVCGLSMGGYVTLALWRRHPGRVRALVLADTRAGADDAKGRAKREELIALARSAGAGAVAEAMLPGVLGKTARARNPALVDEFRAMCASASVAGVVAALEAMMTRPDATALLPTITVPTLVLVGDEDVLTPPAEARALHAGIAGSRLEVVEGAGHLSNMERPGVFNFVVREFLRALDG